MALVRHVLENKGDANSSNAAGWTPLILAAMADRPGLPESRVGKVVS